MGVLCRRGRECRVCAAEDYNGRGEKEVSAAASGWAWMPLPRRHQSKMAAICTMIRFACHYY